MRFTGGLTYIYIKVVLTLAYMGYMKELGYYLYENKPERFICPKGILYLCGGERLKNDER